MSHFSFMHPKHMLLQTLIKIDHEYALLSESSVSPNLFRNSQNFNFRGFTVIWISP